jgi:hypothetical protein
MKKLIVFFLCFFCALWCASSCKKKGDPCPPEVDFEMSFQNEYYKVPDFAEKVIEKMVVDTIMNGQKVTFEATDSGASEYEWLIGEETSPRKGKKINLEFNILVLNNPLILDIQLTAKFNADNNCRNYPDNKKVVRKKLCILVEPGYFGKYRGYDTQAPDKPYEITIGHIPNLPSGYPNYRDYVENLATIFYGSDINRYMSVEGLYRTFGIGGSEQDLYRKASICDWSKCSASGYVDGSRNNIVINYRVELRYSYPYEYRNHTFVGKRIP